MYGVVLNTFMLRDRADYTKTVHRSRSEHPRTHGKGTAQALLPGAAEPGARYATVASVRLPGGEVLEGRGVSPDVALPAQPEKTL